jgi:transglutaminase-like putative cysteine protease
MTAAPPTRRASRFTFPSQRTWIDIAVLTVLSLIGLLGFAVSFSSGLYLVAGMGGLLVGTAAGILAASLRLGPLPTGLLAVLAYFLFGSPLTMPTFATFGVLPSAASVSGLAVGAVFGWRDIVTLTTPVVAPDYIAVLPYVATWIVGLVSSTIATRWFTSHRRTPLSSLGALLAPTALYVTGVLTGTAEPYLAAVRGVAFATIALVWLAWRVPQSTNANLGSTSGLLRRKLIGVGSIALVTIVGGALLGAASAPSTSQRYVLRENIQPPFDPLIYPSPLSGFRIFTKDTSADALFTVDGMNAGERIRIATMDSYDGQIWNVTSAAGDAHSSGSFGLVGEQLGGAPLGGAVDHRTLSIAIDHYNGRWIPTVGYATSIHFQAQAPLSTDLRYNRQTGVLIDTAALHSGQTYNLNVDSQTDPKDGDLETVPPAGLSQSPITEQPDLIQSKATEFAGKATTPIDKLRAIEAAFKKQGVLSHGRANDAVPSRAGHGADRMKLLLSQTPMVGDQEQYASAFALMARSLGYPARVVMGFAPKSITAGQKVTVASKDVSAWVEVAFQGVGWVTFDPTPDASNQPTVIPSKPKTEALPQVRQPPRTTGNQNNLVAPTEISKQQKSPDAFVLPGWVVPTALGIGIPLAAYFIPLLVIAAIKRRRRRHRREDGTADRRAAGAWDELTDAYAELGYRVPRTATRVQTALLFEQQFSDQLEVRERERADVAQRASNRTARAAAKAESKAKEGQTHSATQTASAVMGGAMARLKDASTWRPGVAGDNDALPVLPGLREFAVASDRAVFSGTSVADEAIDGLWSDLAGAEDAARRSVSWFRRRLSGFRIRARFDLVRVITRLAAMSAQLKLTRKAAPQ